MLKAETGSRGWMANFEAKNKVEFVLSVSAQSGMYSGLTYPPAFGMPATVEKTLAGRLVLHTAASAVALILCCAYSLALEAGLYAHTTCWPHCAFAFAPVRHIRLYRHLDGCIPYMLWWISWGIMGYSCWLF